jgi:two-component system response regulator FlrC
MRLMIIGQLDGYISAAGKIALQRGQKLFTAKIQIKPLGLCATARGQTLS